MNELQLPHIAIPLGVDWYAAASCDSFAARDAAARREKSASQANPAAAAMSLRRDR